MAGTQQELDSALDALDQQLQTSTQAILAAVNDIKSKVGPGVDLSAEISRIQGETTAIKNASDQVQALDTDQTPQPSPAPNPAPGQRR